MRARFIPAAAAGALVAALCASACTPSADTLEYRNASMDENDVTSQTPRDNVADSADELTSTAMVVVFGDGEILFVDQDTESPYYPTELSSALIVDAVGNQIEAENLTSGNIVRVTGNDIVLQSYPAQYPGISKVEVVSEGTPADAEKYDALVSEIWPPRDPAQVPYASASYQDEFGSVSMALLECGSIWSFEQDGETVTIVSDSVHPAQVEVSDLPDVCVFEACDVTLSFELPATDVRVTRYEEDEIATAADDIDSLVEKDVDVETADGEARLVVEPGGRYVVEAEFEAGTVTYVFTVPAA